MILIIRVSHIQTNSWASRTFPCVFLTPGRYTTRNQGREQQPTFLRRRCPASLIIRRIQMNNSNGEAL